MPTLFLFATLGEFLEANMFSIIGLVLTAIGGIIWAVRLEGRVNNMSERLDKIEKEVDEVVKHTHDSERHVNHLHMRSMERRLDNVDTRIDKLETTMANGFTNTMNRLDTLLRRE